MESNGYDVLTMPDHFEDQLAPVPALMTAADATTTLRIGALVWDNDYKHPVVLAKELATMDVLSEGRVEIGLGAGWMISDYEQSGIPYDSPKVRIDRFAEGLAIIKGLMGAEPFSFSGHHYTITGHNGLPKPLQGPCPPILIGGGGKRVLRLAAREADIIGINGTMTAGVVGPDAIATMTAEAVDEKVGIVRDAAGARLSDIEMNVRVFIVKVTDSSAARTEFISSFSGAIGVPTAFMEESPFALVGEPQQMIDDLLARRERWGFSYVIVGADDVESFAPVVAALAGK
ncbi:MAG: putative oxidoreductase [Ilumatobacteraceae bacterium]|nr:putative oxidoreductase [Ilumatobacteraceae bacterium]